MQKLFQIHGASAAILSKKTLLYTGKYHNIHFFLLLNFLTDTPANFYIESRKNVRELSSIKTLIESTQNARQTFIFVNQVFLYSIKLNVGNKHIP